jgi:hypothetical protein
MPSKVLKTINIKITTREALWSEIYTSAIESGFRPDIAVLETDKAVKHIFDRIGPVKEAELKQLYGREKIKSKTSVIAELRDSQPN